MQCAWSIYTKIEGDRLHSFMQFTNFLPLEFHAVKYMVISCWCKAHCGLGTAALHQPITLDKKPETDPTPAAVKSEATGGQSAGKKLIGCTQQVNPELLRCVPQLKSSAHTGRQWYIMTSAFKIQLEPLKLTSTVLIIITEYLTMECIPCTSDTC